MQIARSKHFLNLYGQYSRWYFHHPGPGFFYVQAWGEMFFYDWLHLVPRPLNAQMLTALLLNVFFIAAMLATAVDWIGRRTLFLPFALLLGVLHLPAINALFLIGNWPDYTIVVPFAALLVVGPSVAAGRGKSLPLLALTCCFLVHAHVMQPLFVVPLFLLAYAGLLFACRHLRDAVAGMEDTPETVGGTGPRWTFLARPWRTYPRAHWLSAGVVGIFLLPILIDLCWGRESNLAQILAFSRAHHGEKHKTLIRSFLYFVQFALCSPYDPTQDAFRDYTAAGVGAYLHAHRFGCQLWIGALSGSLAVMLSWARRPWRGVPVGPVSAELADAGAPDGLAEGVVSIHARRLYVVWWWVFLAVSFLLTLVWGRIMQGEMLYYNAHFNYGLCYAAMLAVAAVAADYLAGTGTRQPGWRTHSLVYGIAGVFFLTQAADFRLGRYACQPAQDTVVRSVDAALRAERASARPRLLLDTSGFDSMRAAEVALELERQGVPYFVEQDSGKHFGSAHSIDDPFQPPAGATSVPSFNLWQIVTTTVPTAGRDNFWPLDASHVLATGQREINPATGSVITFGGKDPSCLDFALEGWLPILPDQPALWSLGKEGRLNFCAHPVPDGSSVHLSIALVPLVQPGKLDAQRLEVSFNGTPLASQTFQTQGTFDVVIPAAIWNARPEAWLSFHYPDAASPALLGINPGESRLLALAYKQITFRLE